LKHFCNNVGRNYEEIERTVLATIKLAPNAMKASEIIDFCQGLAKIDIQHVIFNMPNVHEITPLKQFGEEIVPTVTEF
jgi:alkanesulfonate monooxygenase